MTVQQQEQSKKNPKPTGRDTIQVNWCGHTRSNASEEEGDTSQVFCLIQDTVQKQSLTDIRGKEFQTKPKKEEINVENGFIAIISMSLTTNLSSVVLLGSAYEIIYRVPRPKQQHGE